MVHVTDIAIVLISVSGIVGLVLLGLAVAAYRSTRNPQFLFLVAAFAVFSVKSFFVAYALSTGWPAHQDLELIDAMCDLVTVLLLVAPILFRPRNS